MRNHLTLPCMLALVLGCQARAESIEPLKPAATIALDGVEGRIDHMAIDDKGQRLYVAALGNGTVEVIDLQTGKQAGRIADLRKPQGMAFLRDSERLVVASGGDSKVRIYDKDLKLLGAVDGLDDADNVRYDAVANLVYVGYGAGALAVIDPAKLQKIVDIKLDGHPESFQLEVKGDRIFVNVPDARQVAVVDRAKRSVIAKWPVEQAQANFSMALDEEHHRFFVGCRKPAKLLVLDTQTGKAVADPDCCGDADDVFYDPASKLVYVSGGEGSVSVFEQMDADTYRSFAKVPTAAGARTSFFSPATGVLYVAVPHRPNQKAEVRVFQAKPLPKQP